MLSLLVKINLANRALKGMTTSHWDIPELIMNLKCTIHKSAKLKKERLECFSQSAKENNIRCQHVAPLIPCRLISTSVSFTAQHRKNSLTTYE